MTPTTRTILFLLPGVSLDRMTVLEGISGHDLHRSLFDTIQQLPRPLAIHALAQLLGAKPTANVPQQPRASIVGRSQNIQQAAWLPPAQPALPLPMQGSLIPPNPALSLTQFQATSPAPFQVTSPSPTDAALLSPIPNPIKRPIAQVQGHTAVGEPQQLNGIPYPNNIGPTKQAKVNAGYSQQTSIASLSPQIRNSLPQLATACTSA